MFVEFVYFKETTFGGEEARQWNRDQLKASPPCFYIGPAPELESYVQDQLELLGMSTISYRVSTVEKYGDGSMNIYMRALSSGELLGFLRIRPEPKPRPDPTREERVTYL